MFDSIKELFNLAPPKPTTALIALRSFSLEDLPQGFFNVETASGKKSLGYNGSFVTYDCGETVVDGARRVTLDKKRDELPTVKLDYRGRGSNTVSGYSVIETDSMESDNEVNWTGQPPSSGVIWR
jgi:hypothetical protein